GRGMPAHVEASSRESGNRLKARKSSSRLLPQGERPSLLQPAILIWRPLSNLSADHAGLRPMIVSSGQHALPLVQAIRMPSANGQEGEKMAIAKFVSSKGAPGRRFRPATGPVKAISVVAIPLAALLGGGANMPADADSLRIGFVTTLTTPAKS